MTLFNAHTSGTLKDIVSRELNLSKTRVKYLLDKRLVFVNNQRVWIATYGITKGDRIEVLMEEQKEQPIKQKPILVYKDAYYQVYHKPSGILTNGKNSLEELVKKQTGDPQICAVHRLDKDTSGLVIFALKPEYFEMIKKIFKEQAITKIYRVICQGELREPLFVINKKVDEAPAVSHVKVIATNSTASYCEVQIDTGRTHQIRLHFASIKHPIVGEKQYQTSAVTNGRVRSIQRQMIHAYGISFAHPYTNEKIEITQKEPEDFLAALKTCSLL